VLGILSSRTAHAFNTISVRATVTSAVASNACWDSGCGKPDMFVVFYGCATSAAGIPDCSAQEPACVSNTVPDAVNVGNPAPADWRCAFAATRPGSLFIALYDGDGPNQDNTRAEQIDIAPGPGKVAVVDLENLARGQGATVTLQSQGDQGTISFTVSA